jgi:hypothetical protein
MAKLNETTAIKRRLDLMFYERPRDGQFSLLHAFATGDHVSFHLPVELIVSGRLVKGDICKAEVTARALDQAITAALERAAVNIIDETGRTQDESDLPSDAVDKMRSALLDSIRGAVVKLAEAVKERQRAAETTLQSLKGEASLDDLSDEDYATALPELAGPTIIDLANAQILLEDGSWYRVGNMRIREDHISAWWLPTTNELP